MGEVTLRSWRIGCAGVLVSGVVVAVAAGWRWPLVGDASLMHYVVFLIRGGMVPYRESAEVNLPGSFLAEAAAMRVFGGDAAGWRVYDLALLVLAAAGMGMVAGRRRWFAAVFGGGMFALVHLQDGLAQGGQRDLLMAVLMVWGLGALLRGIGGWRPVLMVGLAGLAMGATGTIKPVLLPLGVAMVGMAAWGLGEPTSRRRDVGHPVWRGRGWVVVAGVVGLAAPVVAMVGWLWWRGALEAFWREAVPLMRWHAAMGRRGWGYLLGHAVSPLGVLGGLWLVGVARSRWTAWSRERVALAVGVGGAAVAYALQGKGYPYQRYPLLAVLLLLMGLDVEAGLRVAGWRRGLAVVIAGVGCLVLTPRMAWMTTTFSRATPFQDALAGELGRMGGAAALDGKVQCLDTFGGCVGVLYGLRVRPATRFLYDCYLFADGRDGGDGIATRERYRAAFWQEFAATRPRVVVVTDQFCFGDTRGFGKVALWPEFAAEFGAEYEERVAWRSAVAQHWWSRREMPAAFRIYVRR